MTLYSSSEKETEQIGADLAKTLEPGAVVALYGEMGTGKTSFVRGMAAGLGIHTPVTSPTFTIVNEYPGNIDLFHFDMYRLSGFDELFNIGWEDYLSRGGICVVEWSDNICDAFEGNEISVRIEKISDTKRMISIDGGQMPC